MNEKRLQGYKVTRLQGYKVVVKAKVTDRSVPVAVVRAARNSRLEQFDGLDGDTVVDVELDGYLMAQGGELHVEPLGQAVEGVGEEEDAHGVAIPGQGRFGWRR